MIVATAHRPRITRTVLPRNGEMKSISFSTTGTTMAMARTDADSRRILFRRMRRSAVSSNRMMRSWSDIVFEYSVGLRELEIPQDERWMVMVCAAEARHVWL